MRNAFLVLENSFSTQVCSLIMIDFSMTFQKTFTSFMIYQILFNILVTIYYIIFYSKENFMKIFQKKLLLLYSVSLHFTTLEIIECLKGTTTTNTLSCWTYICMFPTYILGKGLCYFIFIIIILLNVQSSPYSIIMVVSFKNLLTFSYIYSKMHFCPYISNICFKTQMFVWISNFISVLVVVYRGFLQ